MGKSSFHVQANETYQIGPFDAASIIEKSCPPPPSSKESEIEIALENRLGETHDVLPSRLHDGSEDAFLVTWKGEHDPDRPHNWQGRRKWTVMALVAAFTFMSPVASSIIAPSLETIGTDLHIESDSEKALCLSILVLGFAFGPLVLAPLSEMYGRSIILQASNVFFLVFNTLCGFSQSKAQLIAFRFLTGIGGSAALALGPAMLSDLFTAEERGLAAGLYSFLPIMGPSVGPLVVVSIVCVVFLSHGLIFYTEYIIFIEQGGFITEYSTWRWGLWSLSIVDLPVLVVGVIMLEETYAPVLLRQRRKRIAGETGDSRFYTLEDGKMQNFASEMATAMVRPLKMMFTQPIIIVMGLYQAYMYGLMYIVLATFPTLWRERYGQSISIGGLNYISLGMGYSLGILASGRVQDMLYVYLKRRNNGVGLPEFRMPMLLPASGLLLPLGFLLYGWSAEHKLHWILPNIGAFLFAAGIMIGFNALVCYVIDSYQTYSASAAASTATLRSVAAFLLPLGAEALYKQLGWGWGNTLLGVLAIGVGLPAAFCVWIWGRKLREKSAFAQG